MAASYRELESGVDSQEDFQKLYGVSQDIVGWLKAGERIGDHVVQRDNDDCPTHNFYGHDIRCGECILTQIVFEDDPPDESGKEAVRKSKDYQACLEVLEERTIREPLADVTVEDRLLMLVTCSYFQKDGRFVSVCRELRENENPESIAALYASEQ